MNYSKPSSSSNIDNNYSIFQTLLEISDSYLKKNKYAISAVCAQIAASHAFVNHCGIFTSLHLEAILRDIGCNTIKINPQPPRKIPSCEEPLHVLHILSTARPTGGDTRYVWRWIKEDTQRKHSVVLTRQKTMNVPQILSDAISLADGKMYQLDKLANGLILQAQELRKISLCSDLIVLHIFPDDIIPLLAFANRSEFPPIAFINHSDHTFWIGRSISDTVAHLRKCSLTLSEKRRGIPKEKIAFLPTPLGLRTRNLSTVQAKRKLGYAENTVILLTIATAFKYMPISKINLYNILTNTFYNYENVVLLVIGPDYEDLKKSGFDMTNNRIFPLGKRSDTDIFYQAADIYIDSFPFSSITSLLEAGSYGLPVVTYCSRRGNGKVLCAGAPGLSGVMFNNSSLSDYDHTLSTLIEDVNCRLDAGKNTMNSVHNNHCGVGWNKLLLEFYSKTIKSAHAELPGTRSVDNNLEELDFALTTLYHVHHVPSHLGGCIDHHVQSLSYLSRLSLLTKLLRINTSFSFSMFLPNWLETKVSGHLTWWRRLPGIEKLLNS